MSPLPSRSIRHQPASAGISRHLIRQLTGVGSYLFHDLRHSYASLMLAAGVHPKIVSEALGHSTVAITLDIHSHVAPGLQETAARRFDEALDAAYNEGVVEAVG